MFVLSYYVAHHIQESLNNIIEQDIAFVVHCLFVYIYIFIYIYIRFLLVCGDQYVVFTYVVTCSYPNFSYLCFWNNFPRSRSLARKCETDITVTTSNLRTLNQFWSYLKCFLKNKGMVDGWTYTIEYTTGNFRTVMFFGYNLFQNSTSQSLVCSCLCGLKLFYNKSQTSRVRGINFSVLYQLIVWSGQIWPFPGAPFTIMD